MNAKRAGRGAGRMTAMTMGLPRNPQINVELLKSLLGASGAAAACGVVDSAHTQTKLTNNLWGIIYLYYKLITHKIVVSHFEEPKLMKIFVKTPQLIQSDLNSSHRSGVVNRTSMRTARRTHKLLHSSASNPLIPIIHSHLYLRLNFVRISSDWTIEAISGLTGSNSEESEPHSQLQLQPMYLI